MLSKEIKSVIRPFYRTIIKKGIQNNEHIKLGSNNNLNLKNYKIYDWTCTNPNFPNFYTGGSNGLYNSFRDTFVLLSKKRENQHDEANIRLVTIGIENNLYNYSQKSNN
jgi:hypothetical protein